MTEDLSYTTELVVRLEDSSQTHELRVDFTFTMTRGGDGSGDDCDAAVKITAVWVVGARTKTPMVAPPWIEALVRRDTALEANMVEFGGEFVAAKRARLAGQTHTIIKA